MKLPMMAAAAALMMMAGMASAQPMGGNGPMAAVREACAADMTKLCPDKKGPDRRQCMMENKDKLSDGCKSALGAAMKAREGMMGAKPQ